MRSGVSVRPVTWNRWCDSTGGTLPLPQDGKAVAGVCHARGVNQGLPHAWIIYLPVGDLAESLRRVVEGGGEVIRSGNPDSELAYAVIRDPVGAHVGLVST